MAKEIKDALGARMKNYENVFRNYLPERLPYIIRLDGRAFHTYTKGFQKPWDMNLVNAMRFAMGSVMAEIGGSAKLGYSQSDEISILVAPYDKLETQPWFGNNIQKIVSISASVCTEAFNSSIKSALPDLKKTAYFDSRCFILPHSEVCNYFWWRQADCRRNSIQGLAQANFSHKELHGVNTLQAIEKLKQEKNIDWENGLSSWQKNGFCIYRRDEEGETKLFIDNNLKHLFKDDRNYVEKHVYLHGEKQ